MTDDLNSVRGGIAHKNVILGKSIVPGEPPSRTISAISANLLPNLLSDARFAMAAAWVFIHLTAPHQRWQLAALAILAIGSDIADGWLARRLGVASRTGRWLDPAADITFILAALSCAAAAGAIPIYIPILVALSFTQYALDSIFWYRGSAPIRSRLGHFGGMLNYALVLAIALEPFVPIAHAILAIAPALAMFYICAMIERASHYRRMIF